MTRASTLSISSMIFLCSTDALHWASMEDPREVILPSSHCHELLLKNPDLFRIEECRLNYFEFFKYLPKIIILRIS